MAKFAWCSILRTLPSHIHHNDFAQLDINSLRSTDLNSFFILLIQPPLDRDLRFNLLCFNSHISLKRLISQIPGIYCFYCFLFAEIARANGGSDIEEAVITVPLHFNDEQKTATRYSIIVCNNQQWIKQHISLWMLLSICSSVNQLASQFLENT